MRAVVKILSTILLCSVIWGFFIEPNRLVVHNQKIYLANWPTEFSPLKVVVLSDFHTGAPFINIAKLRKIVLKVNEINPDFVVLLGDYVVHGVVGGTFVEPEVTASELRKIRSHFGIVSVLGNHDWWYNGNRVMKALYEAGLNPLDNEITLLEKVGAKIWVVGVADYWTRTVNIDALLKKVPANQSVILLTHNPDVFPEIPGRVPLTLAGHTHGGQVSLPFWGPPIVPSKYGQQYAAGLISENDHLMYVTTGIGTSIIPIRFLVPPEIVVLMIYKAS